MQKHVNLVDLVKSFPTSVSPHVPFLNLLFEQIAIPTSIYLQNLASIQPRTSRLKLGGIRCLRIVYRMMFAIDERFTEAAARTSASRLTLGESRREHKSYASGQDQAVT